MTFLNALLAFGTLAFTVPLVIHLLNRSRYRTVDWGAMIFLEQQNPSNSRRMEWRHLLLLAVRCLIPVCLALAMARPFLSGSSLLGVREPIATVVVLDDSLSMQSKTADGRTRWFIALRQIDELLNSLPDGSESHLVMAGQVPKSVSQEEIKESLRNWETTPSITGSMDLVEATKKSLDWLKDRSLTRRQIVYVSDFQSSDWSNDMGVLDELKRLASEQIIPPVISWLNVTERQTTEEGVNEEPFRNCSVKELVVAPKWFAEGQVISALVTIHNHSRTIVDALPVTLQLGDKILDTQKISIAPGSSTRVSTRFAVPKVGWHLLTVKLDTKDDLDTDNIKQVPLVVQPRSQILLVDGALRSEPMQSQSDFLRLALSPFTFSQVAGADYFDTKVISVDRLHDITLDDYASVALCNVARIEPNHVAKLREFVERGGGVVIFLGNRVEGEAWNRLPIIDQGGIRFFNLPEPKGAPSGGAIESSLAIALESLESNLFQGLPQVSRESISNAVISRFSSISLLPDGKADRLASFTNGEPWIVRQVLGRGAIWVVATSCDAVDTNLPTRPVFVPLMQRLFHAVSNSKPAMEVLRSGTPWAIRSTVESIDATKNAELQIQVTPPRFATIKQVGLNWSETRQLGLYEASWEVDGELQKSYCWVEPYSPLGSVNRDSDRSDIAREELLTLAKSVDATYFDSVPTLLASDGNAWQGREIGHWFWLAALVCFIVEMLIAQSFRLPTKGSSKAARSERTSYVAKGLG